METPWWVLIVGAVALALLGYAAASARRAYIRRKYRDTEEGYDNWQRDVKRVMDILSDRFGRPATADEVLISIYGSRADRRRIWKERGGRPGEKYEEN